MKLITEAKSRTGAEKFRSRLAQTGRRVPQRSVDHGGSLRRSAAVSFHDMREEQPHFQGQGTTGSTREGSEHVLVITSGLPAGSDNVTSANAQAAGEGASQGRRRRWIRRGLIPDEPAKDAPDTDNSGIGDPPGPPKDGETGEDGDGEEEIRRRLIRTVELGRILGRMSELAAPNPFAQERAHTPLIDEGIQAAIDVIDATYNMDIVDRDDTDRQLIRRYGPMIGEKAGERIKTIDDTVKSDQRDMLQAGVSLRDIDPATHGDVPLEEFSDQAASIAQTLQHIASHLPAEQTLTELQLLLDKERTALGIDERISGMLQRPDLVAEYKSFEDKYASGTPAQELIDRAGRIASDFVAAGQRDRRVRRAHRNTITRQKDQERLHVALHGEELLADEGNKTHQALREAMAQRAEAPAAEVFSTLQDLLQAIEEVPVPDNLGLVVEIEEFINRQAKELRTVVATLSTKEHKLLDSTQRARLAVFARADRAQKMQRALEHGGASRDGRSEQAPAEQVQSDPRSPKEVFYDRVVRGGAKLKHPEATTWAARLRTREQGDEEHRALLREQNGLLVAIAANRLGTDFQHNGLDATLLSLYTLMQNPDQREAIITLLVGTGKKASDREMIDTRITAGLDRIERYLIETKRIVPVTDEPAAPSADRHSPEGEGSHGQTQPKEEAQVFPDREDAGDTKQAAGGAQAIPAPEDTHNDEQREQTTTDREEEVRRMPQAVSEWFAARGIEPQQVDWAQVILPEGRKTRMEDVAATVVARALKRAESSEQEIKINTDRLDVFDAVEKFFYDISDDYEINYWQGELGRKKVTVEGEPQADEYVVQEVSSVLPDGRTELVAAIAVSPVTGPNSLYLWRPDILTNRKGEPRPEGITWRVALAQEKDDARDAGALDVRWTAEQGMPLIETMQNKVLHLLTCDTSEFFSSKYRVVYREMRAAGIGVQVQETAEPSAAPVERCKSSELAFDDVVEIINSLPRIDDNDPRVDAYLRAGGARGTELDFQLLRDYFPPSPKPFDNFDVLFKQRRVLRLDPDADLYIPYYQQAVALGEPWQQFEAANTDLLARIDVLIDQSRNIDVLNGYYSRLLLTDDQEGMRQFERAINHPLGLNGLTRAVEERLNPLLMEAYERMRESGIEARQFFRSS